jgi:hypothetical protein
LFLARNSQRMNVVAGSSARISWVRLRLRFRPVIEDVSFAQVKFPFDPASPFVLQLAHAKQLVELVTLRSDQEKFNVILQIRELSVTGVAISWVIDMQQAIPVAISQCFDELVWEATLRYQHVKPFDHRIDCRAPSPKLLLKIDAALPPASMGETKGPRPLAATTPDQPASLR